MISSSQKGRPFDNAEYALNCHKTISKTHPGREFDGHAATASDLSEFSNWHVSDTLNDPENVR
jgi:hypothetical protein